MSVDQVGSKDSDATVTVAGISSRPVSVDQVGSKDSDQPLACSREFVCMCPLIRLVPRTATPTRTALTSGRMVSVDQVGSKDSDESVENVCRRAIEVSVDQVGSKDSDRITD